MCLFKAFYRMTDNAYKEHQLEKQKNGQIIAHPSKITEFIDSNQKLNMITPIKVFEDYVR